MKTEIIQSLTSEFESHAHQTEDSLEFWLARDLQQLLGYRKWENFINVITKAKTACEISGYDINDHFPDIRKMIKMPKNAEKEVDDIMLTRYACYLIAQNGDSTKEPITLAQTYFAMPTILLKAKDFATEITIHNAREKHMNTE